ncbi:PREDICTED: nitric oxide-inducible gene protein [Elephantulus edwardii]|uniref:nitric oxide-inducible gene protein n=1 Tax=Elephantulus edwardii TaxID=28737 RepID=UPI0003F069C6|nr:PREDICTED: nitric oxide-inducible gene protein [Elephantulus edwardii]
MNKRRKFLLASVLAVQNSNFIYPSCQKCFSRIIIVSKRSNCPKCGSTGEAENVSYRYKLPLKVAESSKLFSITVFGSCLDTFFGLTATALHRYIENSDEIPETLDSDTAKNLLTKAVETCFVGQSFIFGVTNFENQGSDCNNFLQHFHDCKREVKALVASQILLPDPSVAGFTVIDFFHQFLQPSNLRKLHLDSQASSYVLALSHSDSAISSISGSDSSSCFLEPSDKDKFSRYWEPSLELISIDSRLTDVNGFSTSDNLHQNQKCSSFAEAPGSNSYHDPFQHSWSLVSYMDKKSKAEKLGEELGLQFNQVSVVCSNNRDIGVTGPNLLSLRVQESLEPSNTESFHSAVKIKNKYSQPELIFCQHPDADTPVLQEKAARCSPSTLKLKETTDDSQDCDPEIWDDLPFSESLNKFLAVVESEIAVTHTDAKSRKCSLDIDIDKLHEDGSKFSFTPQRTTGTLYAPPIALRPSQPTGKANFEKNALTKCDANPNCVLKESQPDKITETVSVSPNGRDVSNHVLPNDSIPTVYSSPKYFEAVTARIQPHRTKISPQSLSQNSRQSLQRLTMQNVSASVFPRTSSSPPPFQSDSECDFEDSLDFVPYSQSTPVARFHETRIHGIKSAFEKLPVFNSDHNANYKNTRVFSTIDIQQTTPEGPRRSKSPILFGITQSVVVSPYPNAECIEADIDEWVPPTTKKEFLSHNHFQTLGLRRCLAACDSPDQKELPRKKLKYAEQRTDKWLGWTACDSVIGLSSHSEVKCCLPFSESWRPSVPEADSAWSPELFSQKVI